MKRLLFSGIGVMGLALLPIVLVAAQTNYTYTIPPGNYYTVTPGATNNFSNNGTFLNPQIDAVTFINNGTFEASSAQPFETSDTLNFINNGTMTGSVGWLFDNSPASVGSRQMSTNFLNSNLGLVESEDSGVGILINGSSINGPNVAVVGPSYLLVGASNIVNQGTLNIGANGLMQLTGGNVTLSHSVLNVTSVPQEAQGSQQAIFTNYFIPDIAVYDLYWGATNYDMNNALNTGSIWNGNIATAPGEPTVMPRPAPGIQIAPTTADSYIYESGGLVSLTNKDGSGYTTFLYTNIIKGAAFLAAPSAFSQQIGFIPGVSNFDNIQVLLTLPVPEPVTGTSGSSYVLFQDLLGGEPGRGLLINALTGNILGGQTYRPTNYIVDRLNEPVGPQGNNGYPEPNFFLDSGNALINTNVNIDAVSNTVVQNGSWSAYSPYFDNVVSRPAGVVGGTITNLPGSIWINAGNLDLDGTRLGAIGQVSISATHLISSTNAIINCGNLSFDLASTNGILRFQNLAGTNLPGQITGQMFAWSAVWSNTVTLVISNNWMTNYDTNTPPTLISTNVPYTNIIGVQYHTLILDASELGSEQTVYVYNLALHANQIFVEDSMNVLQSLFIDGKSLTLDGNLTVPGFFPPANPINNTEFAATPLSNWIFTNAPNLLFFTNNGILSIANEAHFGDDRPPYSTFINTGTVSAAGVSINSSYFENDGSIDTASGVLSIQCGTGKLQNGSISSGSASLFTADSVKFNNFSLISGGALYFNVANSLFDAGPASGNVFQVRNGFNLQIKPQTGDLLGTSLVTVDPTLTGITINHTWAGENRGATPAGYIDNEAVGILKFSTQTPNSTFVFSGTGANNGLYVDFLDLRALGSNYVNQLRISPNLVIYYAAATNSYTHRLSNGIPQQWAEYLNGQFNGRLRWVSSYAGANSSSSVIVLSNGVPVSVSANTALRNSQIIYSNGSSPNGSTAQPFTAAVITVQTNGGGTVLPNYNSQILLTGQAYGMVAQPADGFAFSGWTGSSNTASPQLTFVATNGLSFTANFLTVLAPGSYKGLFYELEPAGIEIFKSGAITVSTAAGRGYSGSLQIANKRYSFSGQLNTNNAGTIIIPGSPLHLSLQVGNDQLTGTVGDGSTWTANIVADRVVSASQAAPFAGKYTVVFPGTGNPGDTNNPQGDSYGTLTVNSSGGVNLSASLADGTKISQATTLVDNGQWPLFVPLYGGHGQVLSWLTFASAPDQDLSGQVNWIKQLNPKVKIYAAGFDFTTEATGASYQSSLSPVTGFSNGVVVLSGGNLPADAGGLISVNSKNKVTSPGNSKLKVTVNKTQGSFNGSVLNSAGKTVHFNGVILQKQGFGTGYFLGTNQSGTVFFGPPQ